MSGHKTEAGVAVRTAGPIATLELARPAKRNALRPLEWAALSEALAGIEQDPAIRVVVLTGQGIAFSAGFDLNTTSRPGDPPSLPLVHRAILALQRSTKPTVAAVEGACVGASWALALACDFTVAAQGAYFQPPYASRGLMPDAGIAWFLARRLGHQELLRLLLFDGRYSAQEAHSRGLALEVVPDGSAASRAQELADRLADLPPTTVAVSKTALRRSLAPTLEAALEGEDAEVALNAVDPDAGAARARFMTRLASGSSATARRDV